MNDGRAAPPGNVPTLTEVIAPAQAAAAPGPSPDPVQDPPAPPAPEPVRDPVDPMPEREPTQPPPERDPPAVPEGEPPPPPMQAGAGLGAASVVARPAEQTAKPLDRIDGDQLTERVLVDLQRQIDLALEFRLREALAPILARVADGLVRDARTELTGALRELVGRSVAEELRRQRPR